MRFRVHPLLLAGEPAMMYFALVVSAILFLVSNLIAWRAKHPVAPILGVALLTGLASAGICMIVLPPVVLQAPLVCVVALIWGASRARLRFFLTLSSVAALVSFGIPGYFALRQTRHLQEAFPYTSMDDRLPPKKQHPPGALPAAAADRLTEMETLLEDKAPRWSSFYRNSALRDIHEDTVRIFVGQPGFGVSRMTGVSEAMLNRGPHQEPPIPQPGTPSASPWLPEQLRKEPTEAKPLDDLFSLHRDGVVDFVNLPGFGYIKDRQHVSGFQEHQVSRMPAPSRPWKLQRIDLIGLLLHDKPIAYVSENLPRMDELRAAPIRDLDDFETAGLLALRRGEDLFVRERRGERRMLGAIRTARPCLSCHEGERGDLLGAFSYRMSEDEK
jgi:hypothetical protein